MPPLVEETLWIGLGTYLMRAVSLSFGSRVAWPDWARRWLSFVTPAVLGALLGPQLLLTNHHMVPWLHNPALWAAIPTVVVAWWTQNLLGTVVVGVVSYAITSHCIG
ncbi:MAG: AzlD domain-containing protein [Alicyclobacillaceae bacterium]|nr:AzlD domain-containing protein [Alicyclobacillaceae bacterium]